MFHVKAGSAHRKQRCFDRHYCHFRSQRNAATSFTIAHFRVGSAWIRVAIRILLSLAQHRNICVNSNNDHTIGLFRYCEPLSFTRPWTTRLAVEQDSHNLSKRQTHCFHLSTTWFHRITHLRKTLQGCDLVWLRTEFIRRLLHSRRYDGRRR